MDGGKTPPAETARRPSNLTLRILAALVLAPVAIGCAYAGGWPWFALTAVAFIGILSEWTRMTGVRASWVASLVIIAGAALTIALAAMGLWAYAAAAVIGGTVAAGLASSADLRHWAAGGFFYGGASYVAAIVLRGDPALGFAALSFVLAIVWTTDICAYFSGRALGGPKLWPRVSPNKTWAGAIGGFAGSVLVGAAFGFLGFSWVALAAIGGGLSVVSQLGDLFESAVKRRFGVKDSSHIIPGHGGLMDRLDSFIFAIIVAAAIGALRGDFHHAASGLMIW